MLKIIKKYNINKKKLHINFLILFLSNYEKKVWSISLLFNFILISIIQNIIACISIYIFIWLYIGSTWNRFYYLQFLFVMLIFRIYIIHFFFSDYILYQNLCFGKECIILIIFIWNFFIGKQCIKNELFILKHRYTL